MPPSSVQSAQPLPSPFPPQNLGVSITSYIRTDYRYRQQYVDSLIDSIAIVFNQRPGNYLVCFLSYHYLNNIYDCFTAKYPEVETCSQSPSMSNEARSIFLNRVQNTTPCIGFCILGGIFTEGVDFIGDQLIGCIIVGVGLPQISLDRKVIQEYHESLSEPGFAYAYQYPGITRVLQSVGRVIRTEKDIGFVCLVDQRFERSEYKRLLPNHWVLSSSRSQQQLHDNLSQFWRQSHAAENPK